MGCKAIVCTNQAFRMLLLLAERYDTVRRDDVNQPFGWHRDDELWGVIYEPTRRRLRDRGDECQKQKPTTTVLHGRLPFSPNTLCALIAPTYCSYMSPQNDALFHLECCTCLDTLSPPVRRWSEVAHFGAGRLVFSGAAVSVS